MEFLRALSWAQIGTPGPGEPADIAPWRVGRCHAAVNDPVAALAHGQSPPPDRLPTGGRTAVADGEPTTAARDEAARRGADAHHRPVRLAADVL